MKKVTFVFRESREGCQSIEKLFGYLSDYIKTQCTVKVVTLPSRPGTVFGFIRNFLSVAFFAKGVVHITGDCYYVAWMIPWRKTVLTFHDIDFLNNLSGLKKLVHEYLWIRFPCASASSITAISPETCRKLINLIGPRKKEIQIVPNCVTAGSCERAPIYSRKKKRNPAFWVLQIGSGVHKNLEKLIEAVPNSPFGLWVVGHPPVRLRNRIHDFGVNAKIEDSVSEERLEEIYRNSDALFFCSHSEGFGLPILEAQSHGIPVVTSNIPPMPWVAGDGALLVDPYSVSEIRSALDRLLVDDALRQNLVEEGFKNIERFSVERVAREYMDIYDSLED